MSKPPPSRILTATVLNDMGGIVRGRIVQVHATHPAVEKSQFKTDSTVCTVELDAGWLVPLTPSMLRDLPPRLPAGAVLVVESELVTKRDGAPATYKHTRSGEARVKFRRRVRIETS